MNASVIGKPSQSAALLIGILLTLIAVVAHRFLPDRRLSLYTSEVVDTFAPGATYFLTTSVDPSQTKADWIDQSRLHFKCRFAKDAPGASCGYTYMLSRENAAVGVDLSRYRNSESHDPLHRCRPLPAPGDPELRSEILARGRYELREVQLVEYRAERSGEPGVHQPARVHGARMVGSAVRPAAKPLLSRT